MVAKMMADAEDLLWGQLMFKEGNDERFVIPLAGIEDDLTQTRRGQSFIYRNGLAGKEVEMLEDLITSSRKTDLLDQTGEWKFEEFLLLLAHITGGQPSRGEEITGLRLINGINRDCNIFIIDGEVILVTQYHKSLAHFDLPKVIPCFLPRQIRQLSSLLSSPSGKKVKPIPRQDREVKEGHPPRKQAKVTSLEALQAGKIGVKEKEKQEKEKNKEEEEEDMII
ncbi:hypothetical protein ACKAV7_003638 [Fusarium commune]